MADSDLAFKMTTGGPALEMAAWEIDGIFYVAVSDTVLIKMKKEGDRWYVMSVRVPVEDPLIDPAWSSRTPAKLQAGMEEAVIRGLTALSAAAEELE